MNWIKCDSKVKAKCPFKTKCCGDEEGIYLDGSECDRFAQKVLSAPPTNADRIRAMSDEELAEFLCSVYDEEPVDGYKFDHAKFIEGYTIPYYDQHSIKEWLQRPAKEDA